MPRQARLDAPGALHHVMGRGIDGVDIFSDKKDWMDFLARLKSLCDLKAMSEYALSLMSNHYHLLVRTGNGPLSNNMRKLLTGYVINYNKRYKRYGYLFQNRYKSILCEDDPYLLELTRYIHLNPLRAGSKIYSDERILGSSEFVKTAITDVEEKMKETLRLNIKITDLEPLANKICSNEGVEKEELLNGSKKKVVVKCRKIFYQLSIKEMGYSGAEVARFLGVTNSAVNKAASSKKFPEVGKYN
jgi:hypothetical protein